MTNADGISAAADAFDTVQGQYGDRPKRSLVYPSVAGAFLKGRVRRILDVGCGNGAFCRYAGLQGLTVDGADISAALLEKARQRDRGEGADRNYFRLDAANLGSSVLRDYDGICCIFSLQDMATPTEFLKATALGARPDTLVLIVCESYFHLTCRLVPHSVARTLEVCTGFDGARYISKAHWGKDAAGTTYCRTERSYRELVNRAGLQGGAFEYFGTTTNYLRALNVVWRGSRPFFRLACRVVQPCM